MDDNTGPVQETKRERRLRLKREQSKRWYLENREARQAQIKAYNEAHKEEFKVYQKQWKLENPDWQRNYNAEHKEHLTAIKKAYKKMRPDISRKSMLKCKYGLSEERYQAMMEECHGCCPICTYPFDEGRRRPCIDHCHGTGIVRGILCRGCNHAEGELGTLETAKRLVAYMEKNELLYAAPKPEKKARKKPVRKPKPEETHSNVLPFVDDEQVA